MTMIEFEKNIPIPDPWRRKKGEAFQFEKMEIGDSFVLEKTGHKSWAFAFVMIRDAQIKFRIKLTTRLIDDEKRRVWRTA